MLLKEPSLHGRGALLPSSQYEPATHSKHAVWPLSFMKLPAAQAAQLPWPVCGCTVPGLHSVGSAAPVEQKAPSGQMTQSSALVMTWRLAFWCRPIGHGSGSDAPSAQ